MAKELTEEAKAWLRKAVEWVEEQDKLKPIDRQWYQNSWVEPPETHARRLLAGVVWTGDENYLEWLDATAHQCGSLYCACGFIGAQMDERFQNSAYYLDPIVGTVSVADFVEKRLGLQGVDHCLWDGGHDAQSFREEAERMAGEKL